MNVSNVSQTGRVAQHVLKRHLRINLPTLREKFIKIADYAIRSDVYRSAAIGEHLSYNIAVKLTMSKDNNWQEVHMYSTFSRIFVRLNNVILFGDELGQCKATCLATFSNTASTANSPDFVNIVMEYARDAMVTEESLHFVPSWLAPYVYLIEICLWNPLKLT